MSSGMVCVCGKCNVPMTLHPHKSCPFEYRPVYTNDNVSGYLMVRKHGNEENKKAA